MSAVGAFDTQQTAKCARSDWLTDITSILLVLYCLTFATTRFWGIWPLVSIFILMTVNVLRTQRVVYLSGLMPFILLSSCLLLASLFGAMPSSWTNYRDPIAAIRHWVWLPIVILSANTFFMLFDAHFQKIEKHALKLFAIGLAITELAKKLSPSDEPYIVEPLIYLLNNASALLALLFFIFLFRRKRSAAENILLCALLLLISTSTQSQLLALVVVCMLVTGSFKLVNVGLILALGLFSIIAPFFINELNTVDSNTGFRLILWRDTWSALIDTYGLGVGYGTEYFSNDFTDIHDRYWKITPDDADDRLFVGTHSTFYDIALRNGILGLMLFATWFLRTISQAPKNSPQNAKLFYATAALLVINNAVNMGFTSMSFCLGTGACLGLLHYLRQRDVAR